MAASRVCLTCKGRKKKCDKRLPQCSYCEQRGIDCSYAYKAESVLRTSFQPAGTIVDSTPQSSPTRSKQCLREETEHCYENPLRAQLQTFSIDALLNPVALNTTSTLAIIQIIEASGRSIDDISFRYFQGIHLWVPFFCPGRFRKHLTQYQSQPTAEFSLLLLCMCLLTCDPSQDQRSLFLHTKLYLYAKTFFTQLQVVLPASAQVVQAGTFISIYEYAHGEADKALMTIDNCARLAYKAGIHWKPACPGWSEGWNTWWAVRIFERIFYCETSFPEVPLVTPAPGGEDVLPHEVDVDKWEQRMDWSDPVAPVRVVSSGCLARAAQAGYLLDRVIRATRSTSASDCVAALINLDGELQFLLSVTMDKCHGRRGGHCGAIGISIRALFMLHQHILQLDASSIDAQMRKHSEAALDTVAQMVVDIARSHRGIHDAEVDIISPICNYVVRFTLEHLYEKRYADKDAWWEGVDALRESRAKFSRRWPRGHPDN